MYFTTVICRLFAVHCYWFNSDEYSNAYADIMTAVVMDATTH